MRKLSKLRALWLFAVFAIGAIAQQGTAQITDPAPYCAAQNQFQTCNGLWIGIGRVQIYGKLDNPSACVDAPAYTFFNSLPPTILESGQTYTIEVSPISTMTTSYTNQCAAWIDYNQDLNFDASEQIITGMPQVGPNGVFPAVIRQFTVPSNALPGNTRMRVRTMNSGAMGPCGFVNYGESEDYVISIGGASIVSSFPDIPGTPGNILRAMNMYDGASTAFPKPSLTIDRPKTAGFTQTVTYTITAINAGALANGTAVYRMLDPVTNSTTITNLPAFPPTPSLLVASKASGVAGMPDGSFNTNVIPPGTYRLTSVHELRQGATLIASQTWTHEFLIAAERDMVTQAILSPLDASRTRYLRTTDIPITAQFRNVGLETVTRYRAVGEVYDGATLVFRQELIRSTDQGGGLPPGGLATNDLDEIILGYYNSVNVKQYSIKICCELLETAQTPIGANDQQVFNDCLPRSNQPPYMFDVWYLIDFETKTIVNPPATGNFVGRPFRVSAIFANNGLSADGTPAFLTITGPNNVVYVSRQQIVMDVPNGSFNTIEGFFNEFTPPVPGVYTIEIEIAGQGDEFPDNNKKTVTVVVNEALNGVYSIGTSKPGARNFTTLQDALDALYLRGVSAPVRFQFTDRNYSIGVLPAPDPFSKKPAIDLSSRIIGASDRNTITFEPDPNTVGLSKGSVTIQLNSQNGIGVLFGQNVNPSNRNAVQNEFATTENANSYGYISFDGGPQKSLKFQLRTFANRRAVFYLGGRTFNHTIKNCIIENDPSTPETDFRADLPGVTIQSNAFAFAPDSSGAGASFRTFSAGIFQRNTPPSDANGTNRARLDTAIVVSPTLTYRGNKENKFIGNEIRGFSYGIASIGIGALKDRSRIVRYYNTGTEIRDNRISRVRRAGIFMGYEENSIVANNKIFDVGVNATGVLGEANGIELGGQRNPVFHIGFNNINVTVSGNEINGVSSNVMARGIKVEQSQNDLSSVVPPPGDYLQPSSPERITVTSNVVWGITRTASGASRAGIHFLTDRNTAIQGVNGLITPRLANYFTRQDRIANNTVWMTNDNITNSGAVVGIGLQHGRMSEIKNNAVVMLSDNGSANIGGGFPHTGLFIQGVHPKYSWSGIKSDNNAFWTPNASLARFVEVDSISQVLVAGYQDEYQTVRQWRAWTGLDINSVWGRNFTGDYEITGSFPLQYLRIRKNPEPTGSVLSNRGERLSYVTSDVDNQSRGSVGQPYDVGADEFTGLPYVNDVELTAVLRPLTYRSGASQVNFADAEYVMAGDQIYNTDSVPVFARLRNNSTLSQVVTVVGEFAMETGAGSTNAIASYPGLSQFGNRTVEIGGGESKDVYLGFIRPQSLKALPTYNTPIWMNSAVNASMRDYVSPRYRIQARIVTSDENMTNNSEAMDARFYLRRSVYGMMASVEGLSYNHTDVNGPQTDVNYARMTVGKLNADSVLRGLRAMGLYSGRDNFILNNAQVYHYDILDRNAWEPRSVDYRDYRTIWWSQDNSTLSRFEREDLRYYLSSGKLGSKKNLVMASQEVVKQHVGLDAANDEFFVRYMLRTQRGRNNAGAAVLTPVAGGYNQRNVIGMTLQNKLVDQIRSTGFMNGSWSDPMPMPALLGIYTDKFTQGLARTGMKYATRDAGVRDSAMAVTNAAEGFNTVYLGADWRHFGVTTSMTGVERVMRGIMDYLTANYGYPNPVELVDFSASSRGRSVDVSWTTASEKQSGWFEVERSQVSMTGRNNFETLGQVSAAGTSTERRDYNFRDLNVDNGGRYVYRLRMVDLDGTSSMSDEVEVLIGNSSATVGEVSPNPVVDQSTTTLSVELGSAGSVEVRVYDMSGTEVSSISEYRSAGTHALSIPTAGLTSGVYRVVVTADGVNQTRTMSVVQ